MISRTKSAALKIHPNLTEKQLLAVDFWTTLYHQSPPKDYNKHLSTSNTLQIWRASVPDNLTEVGCNDEDFSSVSEIGVPVAQRALTSLSMVDQSITENKENNNCDLLSLISLNTLTKFDMDKRVTSQENFDKSIVYLAIFTLQDKLYPWNH